MSGVIVQFFDPYASANIMLRVVGESYIVPPPIELVDHLVDARLALHACAFGAFQGCLKLTASVVWLSIGQYRGEVEQSAMPRNVCIVLMVCGTAKSKTAKRPQTFRRRVVYTNHDFSLLHL